MPRLLVVLALLVVALVPAATAGSAVPQGYIVVLEQRANPGAVAAEHAQTLGARRRLRLPPRAQGLLGRRPRRRARRLCAPTPASRTSSATAACTRPPPSRARPGASTASTSATLPLSTTYSYTATGSGVTAYVIDTGIRKTHTQFGGRAVHGVDTTTPLGLTSDDCHGHGTHVAGTIGGSTYGVAKAVRLVAVRVLDCTGFGLNSGVIAGVDWVTGNHQPGQPAVANMSLGGDKSTALEQAVSSSIADGVTYAVAAGNETEDACTGSPSGLPAAITVGATTNTDARASYSDFGPCVDFFAPGSNITSASFLTDTGTATMSGTSMASPHVAGVAALYLQGTPGATPTQVRDGLYGLTTKNVVTDAQSANNHLLFSNL